MTAFILMGVSGSGKSTIGRHVAHALDLPFIEGDDFHPSENIAKMAGGLPLKDTDRAAWIDALMQAANARSERDLIIACSSLTQSVRTRIQAQSRRPVLFLHLIADPAIIEQRLLTRAAHFMPASLLGTQLTTLQPTAEAIPIDATLPINEVCEHVQSQIAQRLLSSP